MRHLALACMAAFLALACSAPSGYAGECETAAKAALGECARECSDGRCRAQCARTGKGELAACRSAGSSAAAGKSKGTGTSDNPIPVDIRAKETTLRLGDGGRSEVYFTFTAPKEGKVRIYLEGYTSPIDLTFGTGSGEEPKTHFVRAPDYPAYARYGVEEGKQYVYGLQLVGGPTTVRLRTVSEENCRLESRFASLPFGGSCGGD